MPTRTVTILVRASGARKAAHDIDRLGASMRSIGSISRTAGVGIAAIGAKAISTGISFNKMMETQTVALSGFVGGVKQADKFLNSLFEIAANTPFRFGDIVRGSRTLIAYGLAANDARRTLEGLGNAIAAAGGGSEEIQRSVLALGQIASAGVLHAQDLNQLIQTGVVTVPKLAKRLGMSTLEFRKAMEDGSITSDLFFKKMRDSWEKDPMYKGAAAKQAKTFAGQMEKLHDYTERTLGNITKPLFDSLEKKVLPALVDISIEVNKIFTAKNLDLGQKISLSREVIKRKLRPLVEEFKTWWEKNKVGDKLDHAFTQMMDSFVDLAGKAAEKGAKAFVNAWLHADAWARTVSGLYIMKKLGLTQTVFNQLFGKGAGRTKGGGIAGNGKDLLGTRANPMYVIVVNEMGGGGPTVLTDPRNKPKKPQSKVRSRFGKILGGAKGFARSIPLLAEATYATDLANQAVLGHSIFDPHHPAYTTTGQTAQLAGGALSSIGKITSTTAQGVFGGPLGVERTLRVAPLVLELGLGAGRSRNLPRSARSCRTTCELGSDEGPSINPSGRTH